MFQSSTTYSISLIDSNYFARSNDIEFLMTCPNKYQSILIINLKELADKKTIVSSVHIIIILLFYYTVKNQPDKN